MAIVNKIDSNVTGLRYAEEAVIGSLPGELGTPDASKNIWYPAEPNEYSDFGGQVQTVARNPINAARQRRKGTATGLEAGGGFGSDITQTNLQRLLRGFFFADIKEKADTAGFTREVTYASDGTVDLSDISITIDGVDGVNDEYDASGDDFTATASGRVQAFAAGDIILASGFGNATNNGLKVAAAVAATALEVTPALAAEASPPAGARLRVVGFQFAAGDLDVDASSGFAQLTTTTKDLTTLGLVPGEWIYLGGDSAALGFSNAANNGLKRIRSISANAIVLDKSEGVMVTEASTTETVQMFFGSVIKNESDPDLIKRRTFQLERTLGANDDSDLTLKQAEYLLGSVPNEFTLNVSTADKITADLSFLSTDNTTIDENTSGANTVKSDAAVAAGSAANAPQIEEADAFNTSSDVSRIALSRVVDGEETTNPLFAFVQELTLSINNNASRNLAVGVFGAFDVTVGTFQVDANATAYFSDVDAVQAVRDTADVSLDFHLIKDNGGISFDLPLITLGDGRPNVSQDEPITIPLTNAAATGAKVSTNLDHTLLAVFWPYLPDAADS